MQTVRQMAGERLGIPLLHTPQERPEEWWENVKHRELPWIEARGDAKPFQHCTTPISTETMAKYYKSIYQGDE